MSDFSPTWEEWLYSTFLPNPATWVTDTSGESQFYLGVNLAGTGTSVIAATAYNYYFGTISAEAIALHGSRFHAAGYMATSGPGVANTLRVLSKAPPWMAAGIGRDFVEHHTDFYEPETQAARDRSIFELAYRLPSQVYSHGKGILFN